MIDPENYKTIKEVATMYSPLFTESSLRQLLHKDTDGITTCVFRIGGKVLFNISKFEHWFRSRDTSQ